MPSDGWSVNGLSHSSEGIYRKFWNRPGLQSKNERAFSSLAGRAFHFFTGRICGKFWNGPGSQSKEMGLSGVAGWPGEGARVGDLTGCRWKNSPQFRGCDFSPVYS